MNGMAIRIQGDPGVIDEISRLVQDSEQAKLVRIERDDSGGIGADFDLETVATIIAIVSSLADLLFDKPLVPGLWKILHRHKGTRVSIETPARTVTIESTGELTEESLRTALDALLTTLWHREYSLAGGTRSF
jgi:hypothetical protein